jgi:hypothetical protein
MKMLNEIGPPTPFFEANGLSDNLSRLSFDSKLAAISNPWTMQTSSVRSGRLSWRPLKWARQEIMIGEILGKPPDWLKLTMRLW